MVDKCDRESGAGVQALAQFLSQRRSG
jgi:hypothetical protein